MRAVRTVAPAVLLALLLVGPGPIGAVERADQAPAFRTPEGDVQPVAVSEGTVAGHPGSLTPGMLDRTPVTLRYPPSLELAQASGTPSAAAAPEREEEGASLTEVNKQLTNPVSSLWALSFQFNNYYLANHQWNYNLQFQPVLPVSLTKDWNLITRPVIPLYSSVPVPVQGDPNKTFNQTTAFGDMILLEMLSPANTGPWLLGAGPTFIFPTATSDLTGQGRWQAGPAAVVGYLTKEYIIGVFPQQWWSIGSAGRPNTSQMNLQPIAAYFFGEGWNIGYSGNILANWMAPSRDVWTVPLGLGIGKIVKLGRLPVKIQVAGQWMAVHPRNTGQEWNIQVQITPVIPKLIKGRLFD